MTTQRLLEEKLEAQGWSIANGESSDLEWWADEIWTLSSRWSPVGIKAYVTLLVDPQWSGVRSKGQGVWAAAASAEYPERKEQANGLGLIRLRSAEAELNAFVASINAIRNAPRPSDAA